MVRERKPAGTLLEEFVAEFDHIRESPQLAGKIKKFRTRYFGIALVGSKRIGRGLSKASIRYKWLTARTFCQRASLRVAFPGSSGCLYWCFAISFDQMVRRAHAEPTRIQLENGVGSSEA